MMLSLNALDLAPWLFALGGLAWSAAHFVRMAPVRVRARRDWR